MKCLIIKDPWIDLILDSKKQWEIRGSHTKIRGIIALIKSGSGMVYGTVELVNSIDAPAEILKDNFEKHQILDLSIVTYNRPHAWVLNNPVRFEKPMPYVHPKGAVIWVNLDI